jgi:hypothetical protein
MHFVGMRPVPLNLAIKEVGQFVNMVAHPELVLPGHNLSS